MICGIDHIVIPVCDLDEAIADYTDLGFTVVRGGRHSGLNTHNALIPFADGCYFELIALMAPADPGAHWWFEALARGGGIADFCMQSDKLEADLAAFRRVGANLGAPFPMSRERPDGYRISWELAVNNGESRGLVPFFIRDITPRSERVPRSCTHGNGATGVQSLALVAATINSIRPIYEIGLTQDCEVIKRDDLWADGVRFAVGQNEVQLLAPRDDSGAAAERLRIRGPSPVEVRMHSSSARSLLDASRTHGARIVLI